MLRPAVPRKGALDTVLFQCYSARMKTALRSRYFGPAPFYKNAVSIAVPIMLQQLIQNMVSLIDNFMVSGLGDICMSGTNVAGQVLFVFMVLVNTICMSGGIYLTQFFGAKDERGMQQAFRFKVLCGLLSFVPYMLVCRGFPRQVLSLMVHGNADADAILDQACDYIRIMFFMGPQMTVSMCIASSLRDTGDVRTPLVISVIATLVNTFCNWLLIYGNLGLPRMEVRGAALATVIARSVEFVLLLVVCVRRRPAFAVRPWKLFAVDAALFRTILRKGIMVLFCEMVWVLSETITTALYNGRGGADVVSGMSSSFAIANLFFVAFGGIYSAAGVIMGKTLGAGQLDEARRQKNWLLAGALVFGVFMCFFGFATTLLIPVVFQRLSDSALSICRSMVLMLSLFMPVWVYMNGQQAVARAGGDTAMGTYTDALLTIVVMLPGVFLLAFFTDIGPVQLYLCVKLLDVVKVVIFYFWMKKERWLKNLARSS